MVLTDAVKDLDAHMDQQLELVVLLAVSCRPFVPSCLQLVQMDLSNSSVPTPVLESIIGGCRLLEFLSLEGLRLSDAVLT